MHVCWLFTAGHSRPIGKHRLPNGFRRLRHNTARADILAADQPQPVDALLIGQADRFFVFAHLAPRTPSLLAG